MLTGEAFAEVTDYSGSNLLNLRDKRFDTELLRVFELEDLYDKLPPLRGSAEPCGHITKTAAEQTGLAEGTPVAGGMFDIDACAVAMDITDGDNIAVIAGTWSINEYIAELPVLDKSVMMNSLYCIDGYYLIEECSPTSAGNHAWFTDMFLAEERQKAAEFGVSVYEYCDGLAAGVGPDDADIIFLPFIHGSNYNPRDRAALVGLGAHHTRSQIIRAVLEGITFCHKIHIDKLLRSRRSTRALRLAGGAANSALWAQMFSDIIDLPVELVNAKELGTMGAAMAAAVAAGEYADLREAAKTMVRVGRRFEPDKDNNRIYAEKYMRYTKIADALGNI